MSADGHAILTARLVHEPVKLGPDEIEIIGELSPLVGTVEITVYSGRRKIASEISPELKASPFFAEIIAQWEAEGRPDRIACVSVTAAWDLYLTLSVTDASLAAALRGALDELLAFCAAEGNDK